MGGGVGGVGSWWWTPWRPAWRWRRSWRGVRACVRVWVLGIWVCVSVSVGVRYVTVSVCVCLFGWSGCCLGSLRGVGMSLCYRVWLRVQVVVLRLRIHTYTHALARTCTRSVSEVEREAGVLEGAPGQAAEEVQRFRLDQPVRGLGFGFLLLFVVLALLCVRTCAHTYVYTQYSTCVGQSWL